MVTFFIILGILLLINLLLLLFSCNDADSQEAFNKELPADE